ncbi:DUF1405 domain-containing protein [Candidatus Oscillochloris fontis]|uniref:DUF1405 domain-containing protein n=1 Tax=Candidatus Oscillochloris fontis TaxID=2496868 RepID=UPI00101D0F56|nr:DUF1405 domain-containing protein [Candidatus Oscillochloris fontis]
MLRLIDWIYALITKNRYLFWFCMLVNVVGVVWGGVVWYGPMMLESPLWAWPFIPDCPEAALWATLAFIWLRFGRAPGWFTAFAAFSSIKYGLWTLFFWGKHWSVAGFADPEVLMEMMLFVSHIGLTCEGILLARQMTPIPLLQRLGVVAWFLASVAIDYGLGYFPPLTYAVPQAYAFTIATSLTGLLGFALFLLPQRINDRVSSL